MSIAEETSHLVVDGFLNVGGEARDVFISNIRPQLIVSTTAQGR